MRACWHVPPLLWLSWELDTLLCSRHQCIFLAHSLDFLCHSSHQPLPTLPPARVVISHGFCPTTGCWSFHIRFMRLQRPRCSGSLYTHPCCVLVSHLCVEHPTKTCRFHNQSLFSKEVESSRMGDMKGQKDCVERGRTAG